MLIDLVAAARPNFMKIAPLWKAFATESWAEPRIIHTGQHYDHAMSQVFFDELGMPAPHVNLGIGSGSHGQQTGRTLEVYEQQLVRDRPDLVIVVGDVNATAAASLAAAKLGVKIAHLEAGLRSFDRTMPEEINRKITDAICDYLWTPSEDADANLANEGIDHARVERVGNIMIDTLTMLMPSIMQEKVLETVGLGERQYALVTLHRPGNVDSADSLASLCGILLRCSDMVPLVFPLHPRTRAKLQDFGLLASLENSASVHLMPPLPYRAFMRLVAGSLAVITDSGGVQEETSFLGIPCLTLRQNTERPITITLGTNQLVEPCQLPQKLENALTSGRRATRIPLWDGKTAARIVKFVRERLLTL